MRTTNGTGRGERARIAERVRDLLGDPVGDDSASQRPGERAGGAGWLPGTDLNLPFAGSRRIRATTLRERLRWDPGRRGVAATAVVLVAVVVVTVWWFLASRPTALPLDAGATASDSTALTGVADSGVLPTAAESGSPSAVPSMSLGDGSASPAPTPTVAPVVVDVAGRVRRPGIYRLPADARVYDALQAAGGARPGVSTLALDLAAPVQDGQQIVVGAKGAVVAPVAAIPGAPEATGSGTGPAAIIDLNTATLDQLETLPGIGPVLGQHILDWRAAHGQFSSIDQLREVSGIGDVRFGQLHDLVTV